MKTLQIAFIVSNNGNQAATEIQEFELDHKAVDVVEYLIQAENMLYSVLQSAGAINKTD